MRYRYFDELSGLKGQYVNAGIMLMNLAFLENPVLKTNA